MMERTAEEQAGTTAGRFVTCVERPCVSGLFGRAGCSGRQC